MLCAPSKFEFDVGQIDGTADPSPRVHCEKVGVCECECVVLHTEWRFRVQTPRGTGCVSMVLAFSWRVVDLSGYM